MKKNLKSLYDGLANEEGNILDDTNISVTDNSKTIDPLEEMEKKKDAEE